MPSRLVLLPLDLINEHVHRIREQPKWAEVWPNQMNESPDQVNVLICESGRKRRWGGEWLNEALTKLLQPEVRSRPIQFKFVQLDCPNITDHLAR